MSTRFSYVKYDYPSVAEQHKFKQLFEGLECMVNALPNGRAKSLVYTKLEEAYMWVGKSIRDAQLSRCPKETVEQPERNNE